MAETTVSTFRLDELTKARLELLAERERVTMTDVIKILVERAAQFEKRQVIINIIKREMDAKMREINDKYDNIMRFAFAGLFDDPETNRPLTDNEAEAFERCKAEQAATRQYYEGLMAIVGRFE